MYMKSRVYERSVRAGSTHLQALEDVSWLVLKLIKFDLKRWYKQLIGRPLDPVYVVVKNPEDGDLYLVKTLTFTFGEEMWVLDFNCL